MTITVLGRSVGISPYQGSLVQELRQAAERTRSADHGNYLAARVTALTDLADYVEHSVHPEDPRINALQVIASGFGDDTFNPANLGEYQEAVFTGVGMMGGAPTPDTADLFADLLLGGCLDLLDFYGKVDRDKTTKLARQDAELAALRERAKQAEADLSEVRPELERALQAEEQAVAKVKTLQELLPPVTAGETIHQSVDSGLPFDRERAGNGTTSPVPEPSAYSSDAPPTGEDSKPPRRVAIEGHTGVYRTSGGGLEIGYLSLEPDGSKKQRWKTLEPEADIAAAVQIREQVLELEAAKV